MEKIKILRLAEVWTELLLMHAVAACKITSVTSKKLPNVYKSCPKIISLEKWKFLTPLQKLPKNGDNLGTKIVETGFEKSPKVQ